MPSAISILGRQVLAVLPGPISAYSLALTNSADIEYRYQCWMAAEYFVSGRYYAIAGQSIYYQGGTLLLPSSTLDTAIVAYWPRSGIQFDWDVA